MINMFRLARRQVHTLISRETIKPSSPTPSHLKSYNLSLLDMFSPPVNMPLVIFYPNYGSSTTSSWEKATQLKKSLSQTLSHYYPFSGRLVDGGANVDCNDDGAEFVEAQIDAPLSEFVDPRVLGYQPLDQLFPTGRIWGFGYNPSSRLLMVQLSHFACGGLALAVSLSHKLADAFGLCIFVNHWAAVNQQNFGDMRAQVLPHFISSPKSNDAYVPRDVHIKENKFVTKKFVFPNTKVAQLKAKVIKGHIPGEDAEITTMNPTRVEVLHSLIHGCAVRAAKANPGNSAKTFILTQLVNLRSRMVPQVPENAVGNFLWTINIPITTDESELELNSLIARIKKAKMQLSSLTDSQLSELVTKSSEAEIQIGSNEDVEVYWGSSVCYFPMYQVDFGWGKPIRATIAGAAAANTFIFMDTPSGDGIEALVALEEQDMAAFQSDHQLLEFAL